MAPPKKPRTDPKTAADKAEARSKNAKGEKTAEKAAAKPAAAAKAGTAFNSELDAEEKALFLHHMPLIKAAKEALNTANSNLRNLYKKAKAEGNFTKADFDTAFALETAEKEARERAKIARQLRIAKIVGSSLGAQLDMFMEPDRTPAVDIARQEGEKDALSKLPAKPKYDPSTEQYRVYMEAWHHANASLAGKMGKVHPAVAEDVKETAAQKAAVDQQRAQDAQAFEGKPAANPDAAAEIPGAEPSAPKPQPQSGTPMTRAQFKAQQEAAKAAAAGGKPN